MNNIIMHMSHTDRYSNFNHLDTEDLIFIFLSSELTACSTENVRCFDDRGRWLNFVCTAQCYKIPRRQRFCGSWLTTKWKISSSKEHSLNCAEQNKLQLRSHCLSSGISNGEWKYDTSLFVFTFVLLRPYAE